MMIERKPTLSLVLIVLGIAACDPSSSDDDLDLQPRGPETSNVCESLSPGQDIQQAIDDATAGCTIELQDGVWEVSSSIRVDKPLILRAQSSRGATIRASQGASLDPLISIESDAVVLEELVLSAAYNPSVGSVVSQYGGYDHWVVRGCEIADLPSRGAGWGGFDIFSANGGAKQVLIEGNYIHDINETGEWGGGIPSGGTRASACIAAWAAPGPSRPPVQLSAAMAQERRRGS